LSMTILVTRPKGGSKRLGLRKVRHAPDPLVEMTTSCQRRATPGRIKNLLRSPK
jgi:hypothetical protein